MPNRDHKTTEDEPQFVLDITDEVCPLTFVRTKLLVERMAAGQTGEILLRGSEPLANVPRAIEGLGHRVLEIVKLLDRTGDGDVGVHRIRFRKQEAGGPV